MATDLIPANGKTEVRLNGYGNRDQVREMEDRVLAMIPGAKNYTPAERRALSQLAVAHDLNPFNGEVWVIPGSGTTIGIKGLRKLAHRQIQEVGGNFWTEYVEITDEAQRKRWRIEPGDLAFEARLYDSATIRTYTETIKMLTSAGVPWDAVSKMIGVKPFSSGVGVLRAGEKTKMPPVQNAQKRAEAHALKQRFDVPFGVKVADEDTGEIIDGEARETSAPSAGPDYSDPAFVSGQMDAEKEAGLKADQEALFPKE